MVCCFRCRKEFKSLYSLSNHNRQFDKSGSCISLRLLPKKCPNPQNNLNCQEVFVHSKSGYCRSCSAKINFNDFRSGKTYEDLFGVERAEKLKKNASKNKSEWNLEHKDLFIGENNPNFGKSCINKGKSWEEIHGQEKAKELRKNQSIRSKELSQTEVGKLTLQKLIKATKDEKNRIGLYEKWIRKYGVEIANEKYRKYIAELSISLKGVNKDKCGSENGLIKSKLRKLGITYEEYIDSKSELAKYKFLVCLATRQQPIQNLESFDKRGPTGKDGAFHLDHIYPITQGFENKIPPEIIGHICNLRFIPWKENISKGNRLTNEAFDIFQYFIEEGIL